MRLIHPQLPWCIDIHASNPTGVDLADLLAVIWTCLHCAIRPVNFYNDELWGPGPAEDHAAWGVRCGGDRFECGCGVQRVDFLRRHVFEGLVKGRNGTWEMKKSKKGY